MTPTWQVITGDCLDVLPTLAADSVDAIITDLPYGTTACSWDEVIPFAPMWAAIKHVLKPRGVFVTTASQPFTSALVMSNVKWFRYEWIWNKLRAGNFMNAKIHPLKEHENVVVFSANGHVYNPQMQARSPSGENREKRNDFSPLKSERHSLTVRPPRRGGERYPKSIQVFTVGRGGHPTQKRVAHPTQKPVALYEYLIRTYTNEGDTVLDFTCGSGTTGVACVQTGRNFIGIELDPGYADIARARIANAAEQARQLELL